MNSFLELGDSNMNMTFKGQSINDSGYNNYENNHLHKNFEKTMESLQSIKSNEEFSVLEELNPMILTNKTQADGDENVSSSGSEKDEFIEN